MGNLTPLDAGLPEILRSAGFLFFAFAGYARIATLGEEVVDPAVTIPKAITRALAFVLVVYAIVGITAVASTPRRCSRLSSSAGSVRGSRSCPWTSSAWSIPMM
jgi:APA family basic amino acid/polyamine antiporter